MSGFRIGTFNIIPSYTVMMLSIAGIGVLPFYVRYGITGEKPRPKDSFERYREQQQWWENGNVFLQTKWQSQDLARPALEEGWKRAHAASQA